MEHSCDRSLWFPVDQCIVIAMLDLGKCRCLLLVQYHFAVLQCALRSLVASFWGVFCWQLGKSGEDQISKISMRWSGISTVIDSTLDGFQEELEKNSLQMIMMVLDSKFIIHKIVDEETLIECPADPCLRCSDDPGQSQQNIPCEFQQTSQPLAGSCDSLQGHSMLSGLILCTYYDCAGNQVT